MGYIYLRNKGGLGNQLFIYNFGLLISSKYNLKLVIDNSTGFFKDNYGRIPLLDKLILIIQWKQLYFKKYFLF